MEKRLLFIALLLLSFSGAFAGGTVMKEGAYRWRNDDGDATTATFKAVENTGITVNSTNDVIRLRIRVEGDGTSTGTENLGGLEYSTDEGSFGYVAISDIASPFSLANSPFITAGQSTTQSLLTPANASLVFESGKYFTLADNAGKAVTAGKATELEFVLKLNSNALPNTTYFIRTSGVKNSILDGTPIPRLTTSATLPVEFVDFTARAQLNGVNLKWSTASQQNNEKFEVERSTDGKNWTIISTVKGEGSSSSENKYSVLDQNPEDGINYYRLKQYDFNGAVKVLASRSVNFNLQHTVAVSVYPNPTFSNIGFTLDGYKGATIKTALINAQGQIVHQESFSPNDTNSYKLNLSTKPNLGVYILKIEGKGFSVSKNVLVN